MKTLIKLSDGHYIIWSTTIRGSLTPSLRRNTARVELDGISPDDSVVQEHFRRLEETGTNNPNFASAEEVVRNNQEGPKGATLSFEQIVGMHVRGEQPSLGAWRHSETGERYAAYCAQDAQKLHPKGSSESDWVPDEVACPIRHRGRLP